MVNYKMNIYSRHKMSDWCFSMKKNIIYILLVTFFLLPSTAWAQKPPLNGEMSDFEIFEQKKQPPAVEFTDANGEKIKFEDFQGKVILLNFWATWCPPCIDEMPSLDALQQQLSEEGLSVVTLSFDRLGPKRIQDFFNRYKLENLKVYMDDQNIISKTLGAYSLPATFIIDKSGNIVGKYTGPADWASDDAKSLLRYYLKQEGPATAAEEELSSINTRPTEE